MAYSKNWLPHEDEALLQLYTQRNIRKWTKISQLLASQFKIYNKSAKKCRQRFNNHLNPEIKREQWEISEQNTLIELQREMGNRWAQISKKLIGRTENTVKNKFYSKFRKSIRNINILLTLNSKSKFKQLTMNYVYKLIAVVDNKFKPDHKISQQLINKAEQLKNNIIRYQNVEKRDYDNYQENLNLLLEDVHWINAHFKRKSLNIKKRKDSKTPIRIVRTIKREEQPVKIEGQNNFNPVLTIHQLNQPISQKRQQKSPLFLSSVEKIKSEQQVLVKRWGFQQQLIQQISPWVIQSYHSNYSFDDLN